MRHILKKINSQLLKIGIVSEPLELLISEPYCTYWEEHADKFDQAIIEYREKHPPGHGQTLILEPSCGTNGEPVILPHDHGHTCEGKSCKYYRPYPGDSGEPFHIPSGEEQVIVDWSEAEPEEKERHKERLIEQGLMTAED